MAAARVGTAVAADVLSGKTFTNSSSSGLNGSMTNQGTKTYTINPGGSQTIPAGYHSGSGYVTANANQNSGTYTFASGSTGATVDMGINNTYRYVNASNVYNKGLAGGRFNYGSFKGKSTGGALEGSTTINLGYKPLALAVLWNHNNTWIGCYFYLSSISTTTYHASFACSQSNTGVTMASNNVTLGSDVAPHSSYHVYLQITNTGFVFDGCYTKDKTVYYFT